MHVIMLSWLKGAPVPPHGCSGIERMVGILSAELVRQGHEVTLIAPPGSCVEGCEIIETTDMVEAANICNVLKADVVHDHTCWSLESPVRQGLRLPHISTTHVNHAIGYSKNVVYVSKSQRTWQGIQLERNLNESPVIYVPINPMLKPKGLPRQDYLLYLGRIIEYKGVREAAEVATKMGVNLVVCGPTLGNDYAGKIAMDFPLVILMGEVDDPERSNFLEQAYAVMACFNDQGGWREPGAGVVGEAMAFNTPVACFPNGCLDEMIQNGANGWKANNVDDLATFIDHAPYPNAFAAFQNMWSAETIVSQYLNLYEQIIRGVQWG